VFDGALGEANTNSFRTVYDYPLAEQTVYFFDLYREADQMSHNASYVITSDTRYAAHTGDDEWRNDHLEVYRWWGFRFEYYMNATSSVGIDEEVANEIIVYPNLAADNMVVTLNLGSEISSQIEIHDLAGRLIYTTAVKNQIQMHLNLDRIEMSSGTYILSLENENGITNQKFVIQ
jgi:hypothetical protein